MRLADVCNPHVKDEHPMFPRGARICERGNPRPHRRMVPARGDHPLRPKLRRPRGRFVPAGACHGARSSDASVTTRDLPARKPTPPEQPRPLPPPPNVMGDGFHGPRHLPSTEEPFSGPFPATHVCLDDGIPDSAFHRGPVHDRRFTRGGFSPPEARSRPRSQPQPRAAS